MIRCGSKNKYQKNVCLKESELHAQNLITILGSIVNIMGRRIWPFNEDENENLHFDDEQDIYMSSKSYEESG